MAEKKHGIASSSTAVARNKNYVQCKPELERLIGTIISKISCSNMNFTVKCDDYTESSKTAEETRITAKLEANKRRVSIRILLVGHSEFWNVHIYFNKHAQQNTAKFHCEIVKACETVYEQEKARQLPPDEGRKAPAPSPEPVNAGAKKADVSVPTKTKPKRKTRTIASSAITDKMILEILESWMKFTDRKKIDQRELWKIVEPLRIPVVRVSLLSFLTKRGIVTVSVPIKRHVFVEMAQVGIDILDGSRRQAEAENLNAEKTERLQDALMFSGESLSSLKKLKELHCASSRLSEIEAAEKELMRQIADLQEAKKVCLEEIRTLFSGVDVAKLDGLIEVAEKSMQ